MNVTLLEDTLVEGTELVDLALRNIDPNIILNADTIYEEYEIYTRITIKDSTGMCCHSRDKIVYKLMFFAVFEMQFEDSSYTVSEGAGSLDICVESLNTSEIAPDLTIPLSLVELSDEDLGIYPCL